MISFAFRKGQALAPADAMSVSRRSRLAAGHNFFVS